MAGPVPSWPRPGGGLRGVAILGGSFNPLHTAHMRMAIEVWEHLAPVLDHVDLLPCANPPHKRAEILLPFDIRVGAIRAALGSFPWLHCNPMEGERATFSWTWDTLGLYQEHLPGRELFFILGSEDYEKLPSWRNGLMLPSRCTLVVMPRVGRGQWDFQTATRRLWPEAEPAAMTACADEPDLSCMWTGRGHALCLDAPWLDISSTDIRNRWLAGRSMRLLVPQEVSRYLDGREEEILRHWAN